MAPIKAHFRSIPTNIYDSYAVSNIDVAVSDSGGMVVYADMTYPGGGGEPRYFDVTLQALDVDGRAAARGRSFPACMAIRAQARFRTST